MIPVEEAKKLVLENVVMMEVVEIPLREASGLVLAEDIVSPVNLPFFTNSAMDGYAVKTSDVENASEGSPASLEIIGTIQAGDFPKFSVDKGEAAKIMTGAPVPEGADTVVKVEDTEEDNGTVQIKISGIADKNIRFEGEETKIGDTALETGTEITTAAIGFIAELGIKNVKVYRKPKTALIVTGEELIGLDEELLPGQIRDTNSITLESALSREKVDFQFSEIARDDISEIRRKLKRGLEVSDVLLVSGGVSVGEYDYVKDILKELGVETVFWRVAQRPGGPLFFGRRGDKLIFGLPGNPASSLACFYEYVTPALRKIIGKKHVSLLEIEAILVDEIRKKPGKTHFTRGYVEKKEGTFYVKVTGSQGSHIMKSFSLANCLIVIPRDETHLTPETKVTVHLLPH